MLSSESASICAAKIAALSAPSIATVATGMPEGICTVASSASRPSSVEDFTGMPMTGSVVCAASTPARCAALPAAAMITPKPSFSAFLENSAAASGVRCALITRASTGMPNCFNLRIAGETTGKSLSLPMITATFLLIENHRSFQVLRRKRKHREKKKIGCAQKTQPMLLKLTAKRPCRYSKNAHQFSHIAPPALAALNFLSLVCLKRLINQSIKQTFKAAMYNVGAQAAPSDFSSGCTEHPQAG